MSGNPIRIYALVVCFVSLLSGSVALVVGAYDILQASFPETTDANLQMRIAQAAQQQLILQSQIRARDDDAEDGQHNRALALGSIPTHIAAPDHTHFVQSAIQSLIVSAIILLVSASIFVFHWRLARGLQANQRNDLSSPNE